MYNHDTGRIPKKMNFLPEYDSNDDLTTQDNDIFGSLYDRPDKGKNATKFKFNDDDDDAPSMLSYSTGRSGSRGVASGTTTAISMPFLTRVREPLMDSTIATVSNPIDCQRLFRPNGLHNTWGFDAPIRSRINKGMVARHQRGAHPRHETGAVRPDQFTDEGFSDLGLGGQSTRMKSNGDIMTRTDQAFISVDRVHGGLNMGQQLAVPISTSWRQRRMYADTQLMRPPSDPSDMAQLLDNPFVVRNWNYHNLKNAQIVDTTF
jgi:hypothetical protein